MVQRVFTKMFDLGIKPDTDFDLKNKIRILNVISFIALILNTVYTVRMILMGYPELSLVNLTAVIALMCVLLLNKYHQFSLAKLLFFIIMPLVLYFSAISTKLGAEYFLFPIFITAGFLFERKRILLLYIIFFIILYGIIVGELFSISMSSVDPSVAKIINVINVIIAMLFCFIAVGFFTREHKINRSAFIMQKTLLEQAVKESKENATYSTLLLKEMNHRVKNNLQLISSLLNIQSKKLDDENSRKAIIDAKNRIYSIALIHKQLYKESNISMIDMSEYMEDLLVYIRESLSVNRENVDLVVNMDNFLLCVEDAVSIGLVLNELITNSVKHGVAGKSEKRIELTLRRIIDNQLIISIEDGGSGIQKMNDQNKHGFGFELVESLVANYDGQILIDEESNKIAIQLHCDCKKCEEHIS